MFVAAFIGSPPMNLLRGRVSADAAQFELGEGASVALPNSWRQLAGRECVLGVRPEHLVPGRPGLTMTVEMVEVLGADLLVHGRLGAQALVLRAPATAALAVGDCIQAGFDAAALHWFDPQTTLRLE